MFQDYLMYGYLSSSTSSEQLFLNWYVMDWTQVPHPDQRTMKGYIRFGPAKYVDQNWCRHLQMTRWRGHHFDGLAQGGMDGDAYGGWAYKGKRRDIHVVLPRGMGSTMVYSPGTEEWGASKFYTISVPQTGYHTSAAVGSSHISNVYGKWRMNSTFTWMEFYIKKENGSYYGSSRDLNPIKIAYVEETYNAALARQSQLVELVTEKLRSLFIGPPTSMKKLTSKSFPFKYEYIPPLWNLLRQHAGSPYDSAIKLGMPQEKIPWGQMAFATYSRVQPFDGNGVAYIGDWAKVLPLVKGVLDSLKSIKSPGKAFSKVPKLVADNYLAWHYGARLMIQDTQDLYKALRTWNHTLENYSRYGQSWRGDNVSAHYSVAFYPAAVEEINFLRVLKDFDLLPTASNVWDLIPYSFVVDWFTGLSSSIEALEMTNRMTKWSFAYVCQSSTTRWSNGLGNFKFYSRMYPRPVKPVAPESGGLGNHLLQGAALLVQRFA